ncbi:MAG: DUF503 domain-containing protein [Planctomycetota bacterium]
MTLALLTLSFSIDHAYSLKDKRSAMKGFKEKLKHRFNVSVAETDFHDVWNRAELSVAMVGTDHGYVEGALQKVIDFASNHPDAQLDDHRTEYF